MQASQTILVTGGAGYVGSHCVAELIGRGHSVVVYDNLSQGHRAAVPDGAELVVGDLADREAVETVFRRHRFDGVMHFAALSLVGESMRDPFRYIQENVGNAATLARAAVQAGVRKFVLSSTANLFGTAGEDLIDESTLIVPGSPYGESKHMVERLLGWLDQTHGLRSACLRYFNAAGAHPDGRIGEDHDPETHLIPLVLDVALGKRSHIDVFGDDYATRDGTCVRDYIHVSDLADAHIRVLEQLETQSCRYNLGNGQGYSVKEVIEAARRVTGHPIPARIAPRRPGDPPVLVASSAAIRKDLGWTPRFPAIEDIIASAWAWRQKNPQGYQDR